MLKIFIVSVLMFTATPSALNVAAAQDIGQLDLEALIAACCEEGSHAAHCTQETINKKMREIMNKKQEESGTGQ